MAEVTPYKGEPKELVLKSESPPTYVLRLFAGTKHAIESGVKSNFRKYATSDPAVVRAKLSGDEGRVTITAHGEGTCAITFEGEPVRFNVGIPPMPKRPPKGNLPAGTPPSTVHLQPSSWLVYTLEITVSPKGEAAKPPKPPKMRSGSSTKPKRSKAAGRVDKGENTMALKALEEAEELEGAELEAERIAAIRKRIKTPTREK